MLPLKSLITAEQIKDLASRSNYRYGEKLSQDAEIVINKENTFNIWAAIKLGNKTAHEVELQSTTKGFRWKCSCTSKKDYFCEHCTAVALSWCNRIFPI